MRAPFIKPTPEEAAVEEVFGRRTRMTCTTAAGTTYAASVSPDISREALEALDALADAVVRRFMKEEESH